MTETRLMLAAVDYSKVSAEWQLPQMEPVNLSLASKAWTTSYATFADIDKHIAAGWYGWVLLQSTGPRLIGPDWPHSLPMGEALLRAELAAPSDVVGLTINLVGVGDWRGTYFTDGTVGQPMLFDDIVRVVDQTVVQRAAVGGLRPQLLRYRRYWSATMTDPVIRPRQARLLGFIAKGAPK